MPDKPSLSDFNGIRVKSVKDGEYILEVDAIASINAKALARTFVRSQEKLSNPVITVRSVESIGEAKSDIEYIPASPRSAYRVRVSADQKPDFIG